MRARGFVVVVLAGLPACSVLFPVDELTGGTASPSGPDAAADVAPIPTEAGTEASAPDATATDGSVPPVNLFPDGTFEPDVPDCGSKWARTDVTTTRVAGGHEGSFACKVCSTKGGTTTAFDYFPAFTGAASPGETYQTRIWVRSEAGTIPFESRLRLWNDPSFVEAGTTGQVDVGTTWQELVVTLTVTASATRLNPVFFTQPTGADECYLIDDIRVFKLAP